MWAYQAFTVIWLTFGLGYIFMIVTVIADNLSKPARKAVKKFRVAEQKLLSNKILQELLDMKEQGDRRGSDPYTQASSTSAEDEHDNDFAAGDRASSKPRSSSLDFLPEGAIINLDWNNVISDHVILLISRTLTPPPPPIKQFSFP